MAGTETPLILASSSASRREQLERLGLAFEVLPSEIDESPLPGESARALVRRLSYNKARAIADRRPESTVIGSDQVLLIGGEVLGKPGSRDQAVAQLARLSGKEGIFITGLCVIHGASQEQHIDVVETKVGYRQLTAEQIDRYLDHDQPYNCAGSFRSEALGIALCRYIRSDDPTALLGLPLIRLTDYLLHFGYRLP
jgi:MAF protein